MFKVGMGLTLVALGVSTADSDCVIIPLALVIAGSIFLFLYQKECEENE